MHVTHSYQDTECFHHPWKSFHVLTCMRAYNPQLSRYRMFLSSLKKFPYLMPPDTHPHTPTHPWGNYVQISFIKNWFCLCQYGHITICLSIPLLTDISVVSSFWLLKIKLSQTFVYRILYGCTFSFLWDKHPWVVFSLNYMLNICLVI